MILNHRAPTPATGMELYNPKENKNGKKIVRLSPWNEFGG